MSREPDGIDYRKLLVRYIRHVGAEEGTTFLGGRTFTVDRLVNHHGFTPEEAGALVACDKEADELEERD